MRDETPALRRTDQVHMFAAAPLLRRDKPGTAEPMTSDAAAARCPAELLREAGEPGADLMDAKVRAACIDAADETAWHQALRAVELCQRAAELAARR